MKPLPTSLHFIKRYGTNMFNVLRTLIAHNELIYGMYGPVVDYLTEVETFDYDLVDDGRDVVLYISAGDDGYYTHTLLNLINRAIWEKMNYASWRSIPINGIHHGMRCTIGDYVVMLDYDMCPEWHSNVQEINTNIGTIKAVLQ